MPDPANNESTATPSSGATSPSAPEQGGASGSAPAQGATSPAGVDFNNPIQVTPPSGASGEAASVQDGQANAAPAGGEQPGPEATSPEDGSNPEGAPEEVEALPYGLSEEQLEALGFHKDDKGHWAYVDPEDPNTRYRTIEDWKAGTFHRNKNYRELRQKHDEFVRQVEEERQSIQREREQVSAALRGMKPEELRAARVRAHLASNAPDYAKITDIAEIKTPEERQKYTDALAKAEAAVILEDQQRETQEKDYKDRVQKDIQRAEGYYKRQMTASTFGVNPNDEVQVTELNRFLAAPSQAKGPKGEPITRSQLIFQIAQNVSEEDADIYLDGLKSRFHREYRAAAGVKPAQPDTTQTPAAQQPAGQSPSGGVQNRVITRNPQPTVQAANPTPPVTNQAPRNLLSEGAAARRRARSDQRVRA